MILWICCNNNETNILSLKRLKRSFKNSGIKIFNQKIPIWVCTILVLYRITEKLLF